MRRTDSCWRCDGQLNLLHDHKTHLFGNEGRLIVIENGPAWVCSQCGETTYEPDVVEKTQSLIWSNAVPVRTIEVPVNDLQVLQRRNM